MMLFSSISAVILATLSIGALGAPLGVHVKRQTTACFTPGKTALPAEVASGIPALVESVKCTTGTSVTGVPDVSSGGIDFKTIDFQKSTKSPLGFALQTFATPTDPATANLATLQNQLNDYLAVEAGVRSNGGGSILNSVKSVKFFLQFQIARVKTAQGAKLAVADTVEHQLGKVTKNAVGASASEIAQVNALAKVL
ncbi:hypothetical protein BDN70DRAFT_881905 [Pholiota conissans]|uniref:DUF7143 domain-containing protein n=1 Tax=Pholiota conissans TaxID=109636 RepID=A0A9P5YW73_9AGAR|nr:hypothetical protein BDN70DRAFT_881905 [Pholiota conissans]